MPFTTTLPSPAPIETVQASHKRAIVPTQVNLLKLAKAAHGFGTKKQARETLQNAGYVATATVLERLLNTATCIETAQRNRRHDSILKRLGHVPKIEQTTARGRNPILLPIGTPQARLDAVRCKAVATAARTMLRHGATGGHSMGVNFAVEASKVDYVVTMKQNRDTYAGAYKGWVANEDHHLITVPKDWRLRVERKGLANLQGMMTLDAHPLMPDGEVLVYAATWVRQGRGYDVQVDHGYIAVLGGEHFHADSAQTAIKGVRRKAKLACAPVRTVVSPYKLSVDVFVERYIGRNVNVSVSDAAASGSCDFGIRSWCESVGLDYDLGQATMAQVLEGFRMRPQEEVRRAVVYAVRRHRAESMTSVG